MLDPQLREQIALTVAQAKQAVLALVVPTAAADLVPAVRSARPVSVSSTTQSAMSGTLASVAP